MFHQYFITCPPRSSAQKPVTSQLSPTNVFEEPNSKQKYLSVVSYDFCALAACLLCTCMCMCVYSMCTCMCKCMRMCMCVCNVCVYVYVYVCAYMCVRVHMCMRMRMCVCMCMCMCMRTFMFTFCLRLFFEFSQIFFGFSKFVWEFLWTTGTGQFLCNSGHKLTYTLVNKNGLENTTL